MTALFIIANVLSFIGNLCFTMSSIFKKKRHILTAQTINFVLSSTSEVMQKAWSGFALDSMNLVKGLILLFVDESKKRVIIIVNIICMTIATIGGIIMNYILANNVWYGYPPILSTLILSICMLLAFVLSMPEEKSELIIKLSLIFNSICWGIYGFFVQLYPVMFFNCITLILSVISIIRILKNSRNGEKNE